jgi:hypothetical protein
MQINVARGTWKCLPGILGRLVRPPKTGNETSVVGIHIVERDIGVDPLSAQLIMNRRLTHGARLQRCH